MKIFSQRLGTFSLVGGGEGGNVSIFTIDTTKFRSVTMDRKRLIGLCSMNTVKPTQYVNHEEVVTFLKH